MLWGRRNWKKSCNHRSVIDLEENFDSCYDQSGDSYVDIFTHDKDFIVCDDGWIELASDADSPNTLKQAFKNVMKSHIFRQK